MAGTALLSRPCPLGWAEEVSWKVTNRLQVLLQPHWWDGENDPGSERQK